MKNLIYIFFSLASLFVCLATPSLFFLGKMSEQGYKSLFLAASVSWFIFATLWASATKRAKRGRF